MHARMLAGAAVTIAVLAACSPGESTTSGTGGGSSSSVGSGGEACASASDCAACNSEDACLECCDVGNPAAYDALIGYLVDGCICAPTAPCLEECADTDAGPSPACSDPNAEVSDACAGCVNQLASTDACIKNTAVSCIADASCHPLLDCYQQCPS